MKSILKNALVGLLLIAGTTKPVATIDQVKTALATLIPSGKVNDTTLIANVGDLDISYPFWLSNQINRTLSKGVGTADCTVRNGIFGNGLGYVRTIAVDYVQNTSTKLIIVTEGGKTICGIQFAIAANGDVTASYKTPSETTDLLSKSYVQIEHGLSPRQFANKYAAYAAGTVLLGAGIYYAWQWDKQNTIAALNKGFDEKLAKLGFKTTEQAGVVTRGLFDRVWDAALRKIDSIGTTAPAAAVDAAAKA